MEFPNPAGGVRGLVVVEQARVEYALHWHLAARRHEDFCAGVECLDDGLDLKRMLTADEIELVQHDDIGKLNLIDKEVCDRAIVLFTQRLAAILEVLGSVIVLQEVERVHNGDHRIKA